MKFPIWSTDFVNHLYDYTPHTALSVLITFFICSLDFLHSRQHSSLNEMVRASQMRKCLISYKPCNNSEWLLRRTTAHTTTTPTQMPLNVQGNLTSVKGYTKNHHLQNVQKSGKEHQQHLQNNITPIPCSKWYFPDAFTYTVTNFRLKVSSNSMFIKQFQI